MGRWVVNVVGVWEAMLFWVGVQAGRVFGKRRWCLQAFLAWKRMETVVFGAAWRANDDGQLVEEV